MEAIFCAAHSVTNTILGYKDAPKPKIQPLQEMRAKTRILQPEVTPTSNSILPSAAMLFKHCLHFHVLIENSAGSFRRSVIVSDPNLFRTCKRKKKRDRERNHKRNFNIAQTFKDSSLLSFTCITEFTLGQISEAREGEGGTAPLIFWFAPLFPLRQSKQN